MRLVARTLLASMIVVVTACSSPSPAAPTQAPPKPTVASAPTTAPAATTVPVAAPATAKPAAAPAGAPIKLGVLADISPAFANQGAMMRIMTDYAVQTINAAGGINGRPLQVSYADPKGDPSAAVQLATQFVQQ